MNDQFLRVAVCRCHRWVVDASQPIGRCGECGEHPIVEPGEIAPDVVSERVERRVERRAP